MTKFHTIEHNTTQHNTYLFHRKWKMNSLYLAHTHIHKHKRTSMNNMHHMKIKQNIKRNNMVPLLDLFKTCNI